MRAFASYIRKILSAFIVIGAGFMSSQAASETLDSTIADTRTLAAFRVDPAALASWLPDTHAPAPYGEGAFEGANMLMMFIDRILHQDAEGAPKNSGAYRMVALIVPGQHKETAETAVFISRVYSPHESAGLYKTAVQAEVSHRVTLFGKGVGPLSGRHDWIVEYDGGVIVIGFDYEARVASRRSGESVLTTPVDTGVKRIYRFDQATDVVFSKAKNVDRTSELEISITIPELSDMFDDFELIGLADRPFYTRQTFKP